MQNRHYVPLVAILIIAPALTWAQSTSRENLRRSADQLAFYEVPLSCPAARGLACGSAAKPVLSSLERRKTIDEAWLDHAGTTLAIIWKKGVKSGARRAELRSLTDDRGISLHELTGERRNESLKNFESRKDWYRGAEVDRLSEEEAGIIVGRLIHRAARREPTINERAVTLRSALTKVIREQLTGCTTTQCREDCRKQLTAIARQNLNDREFHALMEAERQGYRPIGDER